MKDKRADVNRHDRAPTEGDLDPATRSWTPWRAIVGFGVVSLTADMVYEGARSITGPLLGSLGASAVLVGVVTGAGEAIALVLRLVFGSWADRSGRYWTLTLVGYAMTAICVPVLAVAPFIGGAGLAVACVLILAERTGKAVRSPAKSTLLSHAASDVGLGRGFAVHKALDQIGALAGPLLVAAIVAVTGVLWPAMAILIIPGGIAVIILLWLRRRILEHESSTDLATVTVASDKTASTTATSPQTQLPVAFWLFAFAAGAAAAGLVTFGVISYHLTRERVLPIAVVPLVYGAAMAVGALSALASGWLFDRLKGRILYALPFLIAAVPALAFANAPLPAIIGVLIWGGAIGVQDSTVKALVADLVPKARRATAYGVFAAIQGSAALGGGAMAGALYERSVPLLVLAVGVTQMLSLVLLVFALRRAKQHDGSVR